MPFIPTNPLPPLSRPVRIPIAGFARYEKQLGIRMRQAAFSASMRPAGKLVRLYMEQETLERGIFWRKRFARAWRMEPTNLSSAVRILNRTAYGIVLERGRRPGARPPPVAALIPWVRDRLGLRGAEARSAAFAISRAIARRGMPTPRTPWYRSRNITTNKGVQRNVQRIVTATVNSKLREAMAK